MHQFMGKWITAEEFYALLPRNVYFRQLECPALNCEAHRNRHILFRKKFELSAPVSAEKVHISADGYYKLCINGWFVAQDPTALLFHLTLSYGALFLSDMDLGSLLAK